MKSMQEIFEEYLPDTLFESHYSLSEKFGYTPQEWRTFIRDNHMFIETELAAIAEAEARSALARLGQASGTEVSAIKALLETSKLVNDAQRQNTKVVLTFIPANQAQLEEAKKPPAPKKTQPQQPKQPQPPKSTHQIPVNIFDEF